MIIQNPISRLLFPILLILLILSNPASAQRQTLARPTVVSSNIPSALNFAPSQFKVTQGTNIVMATNAILIGTNIIQDEFRPSLIFTNSTDSNMVQLYLQTGGNQLIFYNKTIGGSMLTISPAGLNTLYDIHALGSLYLDGFGSTTSKVAWLDGGIYDDSGNERIILDTNFLCLGGFSNYLRAEFAAPVTNYSSQRTFGLTDAASLTNRGGFTNGGPAQFLNGATCKALAGGTTPALAINDTNNLTYFSTPTNLSGVFYLGTNANGRLVSSNNASVTNSSLITGGATASAIYQTPLGVGIGTNNPAQALDVIGNAHFSGSITGATSLSIGSAFTVPANGNPVAATVFNGSAFVQASTDVAIVHNGLTAPAGVALASASVISFTASDILGTPDTKIYRSRPSEIAVTNLLVLSVLKASGLALSNINGTASSPFTTGATLSSNVYAYVFSSGSGNNLTLSLATNSNYPDGQLWQIALGTEGTNYLSLTPTNFSAGTADKISRSTNWIITPGMALTLQKQGTNFNIISGLPSEPLGTISAWHKNFPGNCTNLSSSWVECNGQTLSDPGSPFNGGALPDLNRGTNTFLRGNSTTGTTGGAAVQTADAGSGGVLVSQSTADASVIPAGNPITQAFSIVPPYMDVVWIMRVK